MNNLTGDIGQANVAPLKRFLRMALLFRNALCNFSDDRRQAGVVDGLLTSCRRENIDAAAVPCAQVFKEMLNALRDRQQVRCGLYTFAFRVCESQHLGLGVVVGPAGTQQLQEALTTQQNFAADRVPDLQARSGQLGPKKLELGVTEDAFARRLEFLNSRYQGYRISRQLEHRGVGRCTSRVQVGVSAVCESRLEVRAKDVRLPADAHAHEPRQNVANSLGCDSVGGQSDQFRPRCDHVALEDRLYIAGGVLACAFEVCDIRGEQRLETAQCCSLSRGFEVGETGFGTDETFK